MRLLMNKAILKSLLTTSGVTALRARWLPPGLYCFTYHRIGDPLACGYDREVFSCTARHFEEHVAWIRKHFEIVTLSKLLFLAANRQGHDRPLALITFDDGYIDSYTTAFPILKKCKASAVFFLPTAFIGTGRMPWWDEMAWILRHSSKEQISPWGSARSFRLDDQNIGRSIRDVLRLAKTRRIPFREQIDELAEACSSIVPSFPSFPNSSLGTRGNSEPLFLDWNQAREMHSAGMDIGSHTHSHPLLAHLTPQAQERELADSKMILETELRETISAVAYPDGSETAFNADTTSMARRLGYRLGFSFIRHVNRLPLAQPLEIGRLTVSEDIDAKSLRSMFCFPGLFA